MTMKKVFATGLGAAALLALTTGNAQAAVMTLEIKDGTFTDDVSFSGTFTYDTSTNTYSAWNLLAPAGTTVTTAYNYTTANSSTAARFPSTDLSPNSARFFSVSALTGPSGSASSITNYRTIALAFDSALSSLTGVGQDTNITVDVSFDGSRRGSNIQQRSVTGGTVLVTQYTPDRVAVPEPLSILGAATAVGFGVAFKRRALKNNKKA